MPTDPAEREGGIAALSFQERVANWMLQCFTPEITADRLERGDRLLEEVLELLQSGDYPPERVAALCDYVYGRPVGEPSQEVGGVMVTLAAYCGAHDLDMHACGHYELLRISQPATIERIRAKQAAKPTGSALPVAQPSLLAERDALKEADAVFRRQIIEAAYEAWQDAEDVGSDAPDIIREIAAERDRAESDADGWKRVSEAKEAQIETLHGERDALKRAL